MNVPRFSVRNPVAVNLLMWAVLVGGAWAWFDLVREFFPNLQAEQVFITVPYPGATPEEVEKSVARLVEREIEDVEQIKKVETRVLEGLAIVTVTLEDRADRGRAMADLRAEVDKVRPDLPDGAEDPQVAEARPRLPVVSVVVHGDVPERVLHEAAREVREELLDLPSVSEVLATGLREREILVEVRPERLEAHELTFEEVGRAVAATNLDLPGGLLRGGRTYVRVRTMGEEQTARRIEEIVVRTAAEGGVVRLSDIAEVREGFEERVERGRFQGRPAVSLTVFKTPEQDAIQISAAVKRWVADHATMRGGSVRLDVTTDLARFIEQRLDLMVRNARAGLLLVLIVLALFLDLRVALWVAVGLPVAFGGTFLLMAAFGLSLNFISLFGLIVVLGLLVDDAIVVGENVFTKRREGLPPMEAAEQGARQVGAPVLAAVITTCLAFLPLAFIAGELGNMLAVLPAIVILALGFSLVEAFVVLPSHLAHVRVGGGGRTTLGRGLARAGEARHRLFEDVLPRLLERGLRPALRWRYVTSAVAIACLLVALGLVAGGIVPFVFLQDADAETLTAKLEMAAGTPEEETLRMLTRIEEIAAAHPEVRTVFSVVGTSFGDRGRESAADPATVGQVVLELLAAEEREDRGLGTSVALLASLRRATADLPGVRRLAWDARAGGPGGPDIEILVRGEHLADVQRAVAEVRREVSGYAGVDEVHDDLELGKLEARLRLRPAGRLLDLTTRDLARDVRDALFGMEAQDLQIGDEQVTVRVVLPPEARRDLADLDRLRIRTPAGRRVPLAEVASVTTDRGYASLARVDGRRAVTVTAEVDDAVGNVTQITTSLGQRLADLSERVPGTSFSFEGQRKQMRESLSALAIGFPAALLGIFVVIAVVFRSYAQPVIVMGAIPFGLVGAIVGHAIAGYPFTLLSMIGTVALSGIVVNDGLILVDVANRLRREGMRATEAIVRAARMRLRAILLTSITTIVGLAPLMLERSFQAQFLIPMAVAIVYGLAFATVLTLVLLPTFYMIFEDMRAAARWLWTGRFARQMPADPQDDVAASHAPTR